MLNPNLFFNKELGYIDHIKSWYQLEFFLQEKAMPSPVFPYLIVDDCISEINSLFRIFFKYWDVCSKRYQEYTSLQVEFITCELYQCLHDYWELKKWNIEELKTICAAMDVLYPCLNPYFFLDQKLAYIQHIKTCFILKEILFFLAEK